MSEVWMEGKAYIYGACNPPLPKMQVNSVEED